MATKFSDPRIKPIVLGLAYTDFQLDLLKGRRDWNNPYSRWLVHKLSVAGFKVAIKGPNATISSPVATYPEFNIGSLLIEYRMEILPWEFLDAAVMDVIDGVPILQCRIRREGFSNVENKHLKIPDDKPRKLWVVGRLDVDAMNEWGFQSRVGRSAQSARRIAATVARVAAKKDATKAKAQTRATARAKKVEATIDEDDAEVLRGMGI